MRSSDWGSDVCSSDLVVVSDVRLEEANRSAQPTLENLRTIPWIIVRNGLVGEVVCETQLGFNIIDSLRLGNPPAKIHGHSPCVIFGLVTHESELVITPPFLCLPSPKSPGVSFVITKEEHTNT